MRFYRPHINYSLILQAIIARRNIEQNHMLREKLCKLLISIDPSSYLYTFIKGMMYGCPSGVGLRPYGHDSTDPVQISLFP